MSRPSREAVLTALLAKISSALVVGFTADLSAKSAVLSNPSATTNLFVGLPVFGPQFPGGTVITALSPLTVSLPATANARAQALTSGFATVGRRAKFLADTPMPALYVKAPDEDLTYQGINQVQMIKAEVWLGTRAGEDPDVVPETALNNMLDAVQGALKPDDLQRGICTLGGLVSWCRMNGKVEKDTGDLGPIAVAVADVEIFVP